MKTVNSIAKIALPLPIDTLFDYSIPKNLTGKIRKGMRAWVIFNNRKVSGYVTGFSKRSSLKKINPILDIVNGVPLISEEILELAKEISRLNPASLGQVLEVTLPYQLRKIGPVSVIEPAFGANANKINPSQKEEDTYVRFASLNTVLDFLKAEIKPQIERNRAVIFLAQDINNLIHIFEELKKSLSCRIGIWHGRLPKARMSEAWNDIANGRIDVLVGTRSCIFAPLNNIGLIIVHQEGSYAYKSDQVPYYNAREVAIMRAGLINSKIILTSQIPSSEVYKMLRDKKLLNRELDKEKKLPLVSFHRENFREEISPLIEKEIRGSLVLNKKILIFLNKKGFSTYIYCRKCKQAVLCDRCSLPLRHEFSLKKLECPHCLAKKEMVEICPKCESSYVKYSGLGIEKLGSLLTRVFPRAKIALQDEIAKKELELKDCDIILATQAVFNITGFYPDHTVVWDLNSMLNTSNYRSGEDVFIILAKLMHMTKEQVIICSSLEDSFYLLKALQNLDIDYFYQNELSSREELKLPPFFHNALVSIRSRDKKISENTADKLYNILKKNKARGIDISEPFSSQRYRLRSKYYRYILLKSKDLARLSSKIKNSIAKAHSNKVTITANINPF